MDIFGISASDHDRLFVCVPLWWIDYEGRRLLVAPTPMVSPYHCTLALCQDLRSLLFHIAVAEPCAFALLSVFMSALAGESVDFVHVFESAATLAE